MFHSETIWDIFLTGRQNKVRLKLNELQTNLLEYYLSCLRGGNAQATPGCPGVVRYRLLSRRVKTPTRSFVGVFCCL